MSWKYPQANREVRLSTRNSRATESSTILGVESRIRSTADLDSSLVSPSRNRNLSIMSAATPNRSTAGSKKGAVKPDVFKRNYLTRVLMCRMLSVRWALKQMELIPESVFRPGPSFDMAKKIVMKGRINLESSVLRTLLFAFDRNSNKKISVNMKVERMQNLFVLPKGGEEEGGEREAILKLAEIVGQYKRIAVRQFEKHAKIGQALQRYWNRYYQNVAGCCQQAFFRLKMLPDLKKPTALVDGGMLLSKKMGVLLGLGEKYTMLQREAIKCIYTNYVVIKCQEKHIAKALLVYSKLRKEQAFWLWRNSSVELKQKKQQNVVVEAKKLQALQRIVQRRYFRVFLKINRKLSLIKRVAIRLGCNTQINEQKAFWRMLANAKGGFA